MTKPADAAVERIRQPRKAAIWTRDRIAHLIKLYHQHECLWNHFISSYKSKGNRNKAIEDICKTLHITKFDFGKKIHNLRNQFNAEMKKLERCIQEMGGNSAELSAGQGCRWEHFESLMFLRNVIEPRPTGFQVTGTCGGITGASFPQPKKIRVKYDYTSEEDSTADHLAQNGTVANGEQVTEYQCEETTVAGDEEENATLAEQISMDDFQNYDEVEVPTAIERGDMYDQKYNPPTNTITGTVNSRNSATSSAHKVTITTTTLPAISNRTYHAANLQKGLPIQQQEVIQLEDATQHLPTGTVIELPPNTTTTTSFSRSASVEQSAHLSDSPQRNLQRDNTAVCVSGIVRDQWDAFGELIASEFRHLGSDRSRKKLKRKIMQAMLEVGEEDDELSGNTTIN